MFGLFQDSRKCRCDVWSMHMISAFALNHAILRWECKLLLASDKVHKRASIEDFKSRLFVLDLFISFTSIVEQWPTFFSLLHCEVKA